MNHVRKHRAAAWFGAVLTSMMVFGMADAVRAVNVAADGLPFRLTLLHTNDAESKLISAGQGLEDFGGAARFATVLEDLRQEALSYDPPHRLRTGVLTVSSGDNYLAGPEFNASLEHGVPFYDTIALREMDFDVKAIGNHEFDFGPDVFADFVTGFGDVTNPDRPVKVPVFVSANLDFSQEPRLADLVQKRTIRKSIIVNQGGVRIGVVGATTPRLAYISSPRYVRVDPEVRARVQEEIDAMQARGVNKILFISHLQSIQEDLALLGQLHGVDIAVAGGGSELLANPDDILVPGDEGIVYGEYPLIALDADNREVPVVTTFGEYRYVGRLVVDFDGNGEIVAISDVSGPVRVAGGSQPDAVEPNALIQAEVVEPVSAYVAGLAAQVIGETEVELDGRRSFVRSVETNEGNLVADALLWQAGELAAQFGAPAPDIALQNGGGIRNNSIIPVGPVTALNTFQILPFANFVCVVPAIGAQQFKEILENAVSRVEFGDGRFAQVAGFRFSWDPNGVAQVLDGDGNVVTEGTRVREVVLDDDTIIVQDGAVVDGAPALDIATIDFLGRGGDQYPYRGAPFVTVGVTYQQALQNYIRDGLGGRIATAEYPAGGEGRITRVLPPLRPEAGESRSAQKSAGDRASGAPSTLTVRSLGGLTEVEFSVVQAGPVRLAVHDLTGRRVAVLVESTRPAGRHQVTWDGRDARGERMPSGVYFARLESADGRATRKFVVAR